MTLTSASIIEKVAQVTGHRVETLLGPSQDSPISKARHLAMILIYQLTPLPCEQITQVFLRKRAILDYARKRGIQLLARDPGFRRNYRQIVAGHAVLRELECRDTIRRTLPAGPKLEGCADTHGRLDELNESAVRAKLREAEAQLASWTEKKAGATRPQERHQAAARVLIWTREVDSIRRRLRELTRTEALTA